MIGRHDSLESMGCEGGSQYSCTMICVDGLIMKCSTVEDSYVPEQMINFDELIKSIQRAIQILKTSHCSHNLTHESRDELKRRRRSLSFECTSPSDKPLAGSPVTKRTNSTTITNHRAQSKSGRSSPQSILLKSAIKPKDLDKYSDESDTCTALEQRFLKEKYAAQIKRFSDNDSDYVYLETLHNVLEASAILRAIVENKTPIVIDLEISDENCMTLSYQAITNFKQKFMMLKLKSDYCLFLAPF